MNNKTYKSLTTMFLACTVATTAIYASADNVKTYTVNFNNSDVQHQTLSQIENELNNKSVEDLDLKILLFSGGKALRLNASAVPGIKIQYENTNDEVKNKINNLQKKGVEFIICDNNTQKKHKTITSNITSNNNNSHSLRTQSKLNQLQSQGYSCLTP